MTQLNRLLLVAIGGIVAVAIGVAAVAISLSHRIEQTPLDRL
jgi:hypothetical protein